MSIISIKEGGDKGFMQDLRSFLNNIFIHKMESYENCIYENSLSGTCSSSGSSRPRQSHCFAVTSPCPSGRHKT